MIRFFLCWIGLFILQQGSAQYFLEVHSAFDDSFREWEFLMEKDSVEYEGTLTVTWGISNDFSTWQYDIGEKFGEIRQSFKNNPRQWQLQGDGKTILIKQLWMGDPTAWRIARGDRTMTIRVFDPRMMDEWFVEEEKYGELVILTENRRDPRDWIITDFMLDDISFEERLAAIFIALYTSTPRS